MDKQQDNNDFDTEEVSFLQNLKEREQQHKKEMEDNGVEPESCTIDCENCGS